MVMLMACSVIYMPVVLPLLLPGVLVDSPAIARSLAVSILLPLVIGLIVKALAPGVADRVRPAMTRLSSLAVVSVVVLQSWLSKPSLRRT